MSGSRLLHLGVLGCSLVMVTAVSAQAYTIDLFSGPAVSTAINLNDPDPTLLKKTDTFGDILGGQRDLLLDVWGTPGPATYVGTIGLSVFVFNSGAPGVSATLQYDGDDLDVPSPPAALASLVNAEGLGGFDFTTGGTDKFKLNFDYIDGGDVQYTDIKIEVHNGLSSAALFVGTIPDNPNPFSYDVLFSDSNWTGDLTALLSATSLEITFNPLGNPRVDFSMTGSYGTPEPATIFVMMAAGLPALLKRRRRRS